MRNVIKIPPKNIHEMSKKRVCGYGRVSTNNVLQSNSYQFQIQYYTKMISGNPEWIYVGFYGDDGISGSSTAKRTEFQKMIQACIDDEIDLIITKSISRFARNTMECLSIIRQLQAKGIEVYFEEQGIHTLRVESEILLTTLCSAAQDEISSIRQNSHWAAVRRFQNGTWIFSTPPYGYKNEDGEIVIEEEEAEVIRRIYKEFLKGKGVYLISKMLNDEQAPSRNNGKWDASYLLKILKDEIYTGDFIMQKTYAEGFPPKRRNNKGELPMYRIENDHLPIIDRESARKVTELIETRKRLLHNEGGDKYYKRYPFSGILICGQCGKHFRRQKVKVSISNEYIQWCCITHIKDKKACGLKSVREDIIEAAFIRVFNKLRQNCKEILEPLKEQISSLYLYDGGREQLEGVKNKIFEIKEQCLILQRLRREGVIDTALFMPKSQQYQQELNKLEKDRQRIESRFQYKKEVSGLSELIKIIKEADHMVEFNAPIFQKTVESVKIYDWEFCFYLKCGVMFREKEEA